MKALKIYKTKLQIISIIVGVNDGVNVGVNLSKNEIIVIDIIKKDCNATAEQMAKGLKVTKRTIERILKKLK